MRPDILKRPGAPCCATDVNSYTYVIKPVNYYSLHDL